jgi:predicted RNase H-like nuclease (RuvC/YqgF family)
MKLPPIHGLLREIALKAKSAGAQARKAQKTTTDPRTAHECSITAEELARDVSDLTKISGEDRDMIIQIEATAEFLRLSKFKSALRTLALRDLESASARLRRELGDPPPDIDA